jgi:hypothetical protein
MRCSNCDHLPPNWHWEGDTYRNTRTPVRFTERDGMDTLSYLLEHGTTAGLTHSPEYLEKVREENAWYVESVCRYGCCTELFCPLCGVYKGGVGPIDCPCEDTVPHPDMRTLPRASIKPSDRRSPSRRTAARRRRR